MSASIQEKMQVLQAKYLMQLRARIQELEKNILLCEEGHFTDDDHKMLQHLAHRLAGTGATYGFPDISSTARTIEETLIDYTLVDNSVLIQQLQALIAACKTSIENAK